MNKRILFSLGIIAVVVTAVAAGTSAFYGDRDTASGNTFAAGAIDLTVDSTQHMNQMICVDGFWQPKEGFVPPANHRPAPGSPCSGSWTLTDLGPTSKFFNLTDIRPGDQGESTISLHVGTNDAYACLLTSNLRNDDESITGPESAAGDNSQGTNMGELAQGTYFFAWQEIDGDNVWEEGETPITAEPVAGETFLDNQAYALSVPPADPLPGNTTSYVGLSWCVGHMTVDANAHTITCQPAGVGNILQTDSLKGDITLEVAQARNNPDFVCVPHEEEKAHLIVIKHVINDDGGEAVADDFTMNVSAGSGSYVASFPGVEAPGVMMEVPVGDYNVTESSVPNYAQTSAVGCTGSIAAGETKTCTIVNDDIDTTPRCELELVKTVDKVTANPGDTLTYTLNFQNVGTLRCTGGGVKVEDTLDNKLQYVSGSESHSSNVSAGYGGGLVSGQTLKWNAHELEPGESGWVSWQAQIKNNIACGDFDIPNQARITAAELGWEWVYSNTVHTTGVSVNCPATLIVKKHVINDDGGHKTAGSFTMKVEASGGQLYTFAGSETGSTVTMQPGTYTVTELNTWGYAKTVGPDCAGTIAAGETKTCLITNDDPAQCTPVTVKSLGYWQTHLRNWILPQTLGSESVDTIGEAIDVFNSDNSVMRNKLRKQLLALKFNIAYYGVGPLTPSTETITVAQLAAEADALLMDGGATDAELEAMKDRVEAVNVAEYLLDCD